MYLRSRIIIIISDIDLTPCMVLIKTYPYLNIHIHTCLFHLYPYNWQYWAGCVQRRREMIFFFTFVKYSTQHISSVSIRILNRSYRRWCWYFSLNQKWFGFYWFFFLSFSFPLCQFHSRFSGTNRFIFSCICRLRHVENST